MINQLPFIVIGAPLFSALISGIFGVFRPSASRWMSGIGIGGGALAAYLLFKQVAANGNMVYSMEIGSAPIGIEYFVDSLNAVMILLIYVVSALAFVYSLKSVTIEIETDKQHHYYTLFLMLITGLVGIAITGDAFNLYVLIEIAALSYYALLAIGGKRSYFPTFYYLLIGSIGLFLFVRGWVFIY